MRKVKHKSVKASDIFKVEGGKVKRTKKNCPRCGDGYFMAEHPDRWYCGYCHLTIWKTKEEK